MPALEKKAYLILLVIFLYAAQSTLSGCSSENGMKQQNNDTQENESAMHGSMKPNLENVLAAYKRWERTVGMWVKISQ